MAVLLGGELVASEHAVGSPMMPTATFAAVLRVDLMEIVIVVCTV